jgi:hypothetical protein
MGKRGDSVVGFFVASTGNDVGDNLENFWCRLDTTVL